MSGRDWDLRNNVYTVSQRTREIGIRAALGGASGDVFRLIIGQGIVLMFIGLMIGLVLTFLVTHLASSLLFGVSPTDPAAFAGVSLLLVLVALFASYVPARRAMKVDPMIALRCE